MAFIGAYMHILDWEYIVFYLILYQLQNTQFISTSVKVFLLRLYILGRGMGEGGGWNLDLYFCNVRLGVVFRHY